MRSDKEFYIALKFKVLIFIQQNLRNAKYSVIRSEFVYYLYLRYCSNLIEWREQRERRQKKRKTEPERRK